MAGPDQDLSGAVASSSSFSMMTMLPSWSSSMVSDSTEGADPGLLMQQCLAVANREDRLISGFAEVMDRLTKNSGTILFCILPENLWCDKSHAAFFSLFLSVCYQNGVRMIKVDQDQLVRKIIDATADPMKPKPRIRSYECMAVIDSPESRPSCDIGLIKFCDSRHQGHSKDFSRLPMINLMET